MIYVFILVMPTVLASLGVIGEKTAKFLIVLPPDAANTILRASFQEVDTWRVIFSFVYLIALSLIIYKFVVKPRLNDYSMRETGV